MLDLALFDWPADGSACPRLLGRLDDPDLVALVRRRLAEARRRELAALEGLRLVEDEPNHPEDDAA